MGLGYELFMGVPIIRLVGGVAFLALLATVAIGMMMLKGKAKMQHHKVAAIALILISVVHFLLMLGVV